MKKFFLLLLAAVMAVSLCACSPELDPDHDADANPTKAPIEPGQLTPIESTLAPEITPDPELAWIQSNGYETFTMGSADTVGSVYDVITDYEEFSALFGDLSDRSEYDYSERSFGHEFVVVIFTTVNTGGYGITVDTATNDGDFVNVALTLSTPEPGMDVTQAFVTFATVVRFDVAEYYDTLKFNVTVNGEPVEQGVLGTVLPVV